MPRTARPGRLGFRVLVRNAPLRRATVASTISCMGIGMVTVCYPLLGAAHLRGPADGALLLTVLAVASLLANAVFAKKPLPWAPDRTVWLSTLLLAASGVLAAAAHDVTPLVVAAVLAGFAEGPQLTAVFAIRHREAPEHVRAQVFTTAASVKITGLAAGAALAGPMAAWSLPACLLTAAGVQVAASVRYLRSGIRDFAPGRGSATRTPERAAGQNAMACARRLTSVPWLVRRALIGVFPGSVSSVVNSHRSISVRLNPESASTVIVPVKPLTTPSLTKKSLGTHSSPRRRTAISCPSRSICRTLLLDVPRTSATSCNGRTAMAVSRMSSATGIPLTGDTVPHSVPAPASAHG